MCKDMLAIILYLRMSNDARSELVRSFNRVYNNNRKYKNKNTTNVRVLISNIRLLIIEYNI